MFGAACTLSHMGAVLRRAVDSLPPHKTEVFLAVLEQLRWFAGLQIRNVAVKLCDRAGADLVRCRAPGCVATLDWFVGLLPPRLWAATS